jgi:hypothetical protein
VRPEAGSGSRALTVRADDDLAPLPKARIKGKQHNAPSFDVRAALYGVLGTGHDVRLHREAPAHLAGQLDVRGAGGLAVGLPCLAHASLSDRAIHDAKLVTAIDKSFKASDRTYGARRVWRDVLEDGLPAACTGSSA